eukprot:SAG31_NODE_1516_length_8036_cov_2.800680_3_plen_47_part_00
MLALQGLHSIVDSIDAATRRPVVATAVATKFSRILNLVRSTCTVRT